MKRYKFKKKLEEYYDIGHEFGFQGNIYTQHNGLKVSIKELIKQGYIEEIEIEIKEEEKLPVPKFNIGSFITYKSNSIIYYGQVESIKIKNNSIYYLTNYSTLFVDPFIKEEEVEKVTAEEFSTYF